MPLRSRGTAGSVIDMHVRVVRIGLVLSLCSTLLGCPAGARDPRFDTGRADGGARADGGTADAGNDGGASGIDAAASDAAGDDAFTGLDASSGIDAAAVADVGTDAATAPDAAARDAGSDANVDAGPVTCVSVGGTCVALTPTSCPAPSMVGDATQYTCGGGLGTECCLPGGCSIAPACTHVGTPQEGWYAGDGTLICANACSGVTALCQRVGTTSQGWYASGHGCPPRVNEVLNDPACCP